MSNTTVRILATALIAATALTACKGRNSENADTAANTPATTAPDTTTPATLPPPAPMPDSSASAHGNMVSSLELGNAVGADNRVSTAMTSFAPRDTLYASVATAANAAGKLGARWLYLGPDGKAAPTEVEVQSKDVSAGAAATHEFHVSKPDGWPVGRYRVEITHDGNPVQTRDFDVR